MAILLKSKRNYSNRINNYFNGIVDNYGSIIKYSVKLIPAIQFLAIVGATLLVYSCSQTRKTGFELQNEIWNDVDNKDTIKKIYITSTKPIDSIDQSKMIVDIWTVDIDNYPDTVKLKARVYDSLGNFVTNMAYPYLRDSTKNYWVSLQETLGEVRKKGPIGIDTFFVREFGANDSIPYNIVLTVDYSGSTGGVLETIQYGTQLFISMKMKYDQIGITTFNKELDIKVPLMSDSSKIQNIYRIRKHDGFGLYSGAFNALWECMNMYKNTDIETPRVLVIFSDGDDNYSKKKISEVYERAKREKVHIFAVAFGYSIDDNLRMLAENTGGKFYKAHSKEELVSIFRDIYMSLRYYYLVTYHPPEYWGKHHVDLGVKGDLREDTLIAQGEYGTADLFNWDDIGKAFERPIQFDYNKADLKRESIPIIEEIADAMLSWEKLKLEIQGHTDNIGGVDFNIDLSNKRAKAVMDKLIEFGIEPQRLRYRGFGYSVPKLPNTSEPNRAINRRTEFVIIAK